MANAGYGMGVVGTRREIEAFAPLGVRLFEVADGGGGAVDGAAVGGAPVDGAAVGGAAADGAAVALRRAADAGCAVILLPERLASSAQVRAVLAEFARSALPAVLLVPGAAGSSGLAISRIRDIVEKAVGADILFQKEGR